MNENYERCSVCGDHFTGDDVKVYCPRCGRPMHKDCYELEGDCSCAKTNGDPVPLFINDESTNAQENNNDNKEKPDGAYGTGQGDDTERCGICGKDFSADDDKVYCPDCGTPMHRLCYNMTHRCPNESEHENAAAYVLHRARSMSEKVPVCDICGKELAKEDEKVYCPVCGTPVHKECWEISPKCPNAYRHEKGYDWDKEHSHVAGMAEHEPEQPEIPKMVYESFPQMIMDHPIKSEENGEELTCFGVMQSELVHFLGVNNFSTPRFFTLFMNMANSGKVLSLNLSAWFFMPLYHFYRRMTGPAVLLTLATFVLMVPTLIYEVVYWSGNEGGLSASSLSLAVNVTTYIMMAVRVLLLLFNDYIYMRWSVSKILSIRERYKDAPADEYYAALEHSGNPRMMYVLGGLSLIMLLMYLLNLFIRSSGILS